MRPQSVQGTPAPAGEAIAGVRLSPFGRLPSGEVVDLYTLRNSQGVEVRVIPFGGVVVSVRVPDREGRLGDVVLGYDDLAGYVGDPAFMGALIGRHANRIRGGRFSLDGREYALAVNDGRHHLHGGPRGFHKVLWSARPIENGQGTGVALAYASPDGEEGYPGMLDVRATYLLTDAGELEVEYAATTDRPTPVNLTQHSYFNLTGDPRQDVLKHEVELHADHFTPVDEGLIPTGEVVSVERTPFDFRRPIPLGARMGGGDAQLARVGGYDHHFVVRGRPGELRLAARVREPTTGRVLEVRTTEPGVQFYSGHSLHGLRGKGDRRYGPFAGFCLETQHPPDAPNQPAFPSTVLRPGRRYRSRTVFRFTVDNS